MLSRFEQFSAAIFCIHRDVQKIERDEMEAYGLKGAFAQYLLAIRRYPQGLTAARLSEVCGKDKAAVSRALAEMERKGKLHGLVTQNIDGLHRAAGSRELFELHGCVHRNYCMDCGRLYDAQFILHSTGIPRCACGGVVKPDVVLYEEPLDEATARGAMRVISEADVLIVAGTSLNVYPAAGYLSYFRGRDLVVINRDATPADADAALVIREPVGKVLGEIRV